MSACGLEGTLLICGHSVWLHHVFTHSSAQQWYHHDFILDVLGTTALALQTG